jgi:7-cyano-7-deazaguanine synthase in queuosine biosynthesis
MRHFEFVCGATEASPAPPETRRFEMDVQGKRTVNLRISDISQAMASNVPELLLDLLEIAAYVYCGDQRASRGSEKLAQAGRLWTRGMRFIIPVRYPEVWSGFELRGLLESTLGFLSDDTYEFEFVEAVNPLAESAMYFPDMSEGSFAPDGVALFSGGIDSFAGALDSIVGEGRSTVLVGHHSASKVFAVQKDLVAALRDAGHGSRLFYVPVNVTNANISPAEPTQRSRSFLFASLAFVLAQMFGKDEFTFYENGVVSLNLPIAKDVLGSRATKTTHPKVIRGFEHIFSHLADRQVKISTPYLWLTKKEVVERILFHDFGPLLPRTVSCVHPMVWSTDMRHCGRCSQCIDRRFAVLAAGAGELEPADGYGIDLLAGRRDADEDVRLAVSYVKFNSGILNSTRQQFPIDNPDVYSAVQHIPGVSSEQTLDQMWELYRRHAEAVSAVLEAGTTDHMRSLLHGTLPRGALLNLCFSRDRIEAPPIADHLDQVAAFMDRLQQPVCDFAVDAKERRILFRGGYHLEGADYSVVDALLPYHRQAKANGEDVPYLHSSDLALKLAVQEPAMRARIVRLRTEVAERLAVDQGIVFSDTFIENVHGKGYRLPPDLREVSRADLKAADAAVLQSR